MHRVGVGVYVLNVAEVNLQSGSFYIDFILTMFTEDKPFESYPDALATFGTPGGSDHHRECSPEIDWAVSKKIRIGSNGSRAVSLEELLDPPSLYPIGSKRNNEENGYKVASGRTSIQFPQADMMVD